MRWKFSHLGTFKGLGTGITCTALAEKYFEAYCEVVSIQDLHDSFTICPRPMCHRTLAHGRCLSDIFRPLDDAILADVFRPWTAYRLLAGMVRKGTHCPRDPSSKNKRSGTHRLGDASVHHRHLLQAYFAVDFEAFLTWRPYEIKKKFVDCLHKNNSKKGKLVQFLLWQ